MADLYPFCIHNGRIKHVTSSKINISSEAVQFGYGIFDTLKIVRGTSPFLVKHFQRIKTQSGKLGLKLNFTENKYQRVIRRLWSANKKPPKAICRITLLKDGRETVQAIMLRKYRIDKSLYLKGVKVKLLRKTSKPLFITGLKTLNYLDNYIARTTYKSRGYFETIFYTDEGFITEGSASNIFFVRNNGTVITPPLKSGILPGITRATVISILKRKKIAVKETPVSVKDIGSFKEIFITNSVYDILPVNNSDNISIWNRTIKSPKGGRSNYFPVSEMLLAEFKKLWS